jgi:hypothetical protein
LQTAGLLSAALGVDRNDGSTTARPHPPMAGGTGGWSVPLHRLTVGSPAHRNTNPRTSRSATQTEFQAERYSPMTTTPTTARSATRGLSNNHRRSVTRGISSNHSRSVTRGIQIGNYSRSVTRGIQLLNDSRSVTSG